MRSTSLALGLLALLAPLAPGASGAPSQLAPRRPLPKEPVRSVPVPPDREDPFVQRLVVKFVDGLRVRAEQGGGGGLVSRAGGDLGAVRGVASAHGLAFRPLIALPEARLAALEERAATRSGRAQPDLAGMLAVEVPGADAAALEAAGAALLSLPQVEFVYLEALGVPPPGDIAPPTPDLVANQGYRGLDPGLGADFAWSQGLLGTGIRLSDCEYGWVATHEDLVDIDLHLEPGQTIAAGVAANGWDEHGTAVLGESSAPDNGYGVSGIAPGAEVHTFPEWTVEEGFRRVSAITSAIAGSSAGDVVLLEMQTVGAGGNYGPAELESAVWTVTRVGTDAGVVVVGAAGNGDQNLDSAPYQPYRNRGDSGAILVGAGTANVAHSKLGFSTYGSRVNVQGWGTSVFTLGYGTFAEYGGDPNQRYTATFSGTSSASPFVAAACAILQERALATYGEPLDPAVLRALLEATGRPQGSGGHIGPFVYLPDAIPAVDEIVLGTRYCDPAVANSTGQPGRLAVYGSSAVADDWLVLRATHLPTSSNIGYFVMGTGTNTFVPPGSAGPICVTPGLRRYLPPVANTNELPGGFERAVGTSGPISGLIAPGSTWSFQAWHRDGMNPSNLTDAVRVDFR